MMNASIGRFYFEVLEKVMDNLQMQIMDLDETEFKTCTTDERIVALRKLYRDLDNLQNVKDFLNN